MTQSVEPVITDHAKPAKEGRTYLAPEAFGTPRSAGSGYGAPAPALSYAASAPGTRTR